MNPFSEALPTFPLQRGLQKKERTKRDSRTVPFLINQKTERTHAHARNAHARAPAQFKVDARSTRNIKITKK